MLFVRLILIIFSLDDFIEGRLGRKQNNESRTPSAEQLNPNLDNIRSRSDRIRAFRAARALPREEIERMTHLHQNQRVVFLQFWDLNFSHRISVVGMLQ